MSQYDGGQQPEALASVMTAPPSHPVSDLRSAIELAASIAVRAHDGQTDKQGLPYIDHPFRVAMGAYSEGSLFVADQVTPQLLYIVGLLHDVVEDSDQTIEDLHTELAPVLPPAELERVLVAIDAITKREGESYGDYLYRTSSDSLARTVKLADIEDNLGRLDGLAPEDRPRLAAKYLHARAVILAR